MAPPVAGAPRRSFRMPSSSLGFTLQEMLITLCISGILAGGGMGMWRVVRQDTIIATANNLVSHLALARSEAIGRNARVVMCPTNDNEKCLKPGSDYTFWQAGWLIYTDGNHNGKPDSSEIIRVHDGASSGIVIRSSRYRKRVTYQPLGTAGGSTITFAVCAAHDATVARYVIISIMGRARVAQKTKSNVKCG